MSKSVRENYDLADGKCLNVKFHANVRLCDKRKELSVTEVNDGSSDNSLNVKLKNFLIHF